MLSEKVPKAPQKADQFCFAGRMISFRPVFRMLAPRNSKPSETYVTLDFSAESRRPRSARNSFTAGMTR